MSIQRSILQPSPVLGLVGILVAAGLIVALPQAGASLVDETENFYEVEKIPARETDTTHWESLELGEEDSQTLAITSTPFFDDVVETMNVTSEGYVALGPYDGPVETRLSGPIPADDGIDGIVAPAWVDLDPSTCGEVNYHVTDAWIRVAYEEIPYEGEHACQIAPLEEQADRVSAWFQINTGNGTIEIHLLRADGGPTLTTGIESPLGDEGNQTRRTQAPLQEEVAWRFELRSPSEPDDPEGDPLPQDDAGTGEDAPDDWANALGVTTTSWTGTLDAPFHDEEDWYATDVDEGEVLAANVTVEPETAIQAAILDPDGNVLASSHLDGNEPVNLSIKATQSSPHAVGIVTREETTRGNYTIETHRISEADAHKLQQPHVTVGVPDTGINPYHETYYRPNLTAHPCTYVQGYPCDIPALTLSVEEDDWDEAMAKDQEIWDTVEPGQWYWIPKTNLIAVSCDEENSGSCILGGSHGTETTSSVLSENPDALIAFKEGGANHLPFLERGLPVDLFSVSWGHGILQPLPGAVCDEQWDYKDGEGEPLYVNSAGNAPWSTVADCWAGRPNTVQVGGAYARPAGEEAVASKQPDVVSYYCRPVAKATATTGTHRNCGTSFAAPTVAGALSKVTLELRRESGYTGSVSQGLVDPLLDVSLAELRDSLNRTANYDPEPRYESQPAQPLPFIEQAPWLQWGWGFYDGWVANATVDDLRDPEEAPRKPLPARVYMSSVQTTKTALYGDPASITGS